MPLPSSLEEFPCKKKTVFEQILRKGNKVMGLLLILLLACYCNDKVIIVQLKKKDQVAEIVKLLGFRGQKGRDSEKRVQQDMEGVQLFKMKLK